MKRLASFLLCAGLFSLPASAQDADAPPVGWQRVLTGQLSGTQAGFQNWAEGGVNTLAISVGLDGKAENTRGAWQQKHELRLTIGAVKQDTLDLRKAEDLIRLRSTFKYGGSGFFKMFNPTIALSARSQFADGFNFKENPLDDGRKPPVRVSALLAPATFSQSIGLTYKPEEWFTQRLGVSAKETVVTIERLRPLYKVDVDKNFRAELGLESYTEIDREIVKNVHYKSTLGLFAAFNKAETPDMLWENVVAMKVNSWLTVNLEWAMLFDKDIDNAVQVKEVFSVGVLYHFL